MNGNRAAMFELIGRKQRRSANTTLRYPFVHAPVEMREASEVFRARFQVDFDSLTYFPESALRLLHRKDDDDSTLLKDVVIASERDHEILQSFEILARVANLSAPCLSDRAAYFAALRAVYGRFANRLLLNEKKVIVAPEREGRILAESLGWLRPNRDQAPHAKRIPYAHGLLVGIGGSHPVGHAEQIAIVDGAIASGATIMALLDLLSRPEMSVEVYSVHAAREGLRAIARFAEQAGLTIRIHVGHVTEGLSAKFYAVEPTNGRLIVGDLGDTIDGVAASSPAS
jgi:hypothetical protein